MSVFKPTFLEIPSDNNDDSTSNPIRVEDIDEDFKEKQEIREMLRESVAQSKSGARRISLDDAMEELRKKRHGF